MPGKLRTDIDQAMSRLPQVEGTGGDVQPPGFSADPQPLRIDKLAQKKGLRYFARNCRSGGA